MPHALTSYQKQCGNQNSAGWRRLVWERERLARPRAQRCGSSRNGSSGTADRIPGRRSCLPSDSQSPHRSSSRAAAILREWHLLERTRKATVARGGTLRLSLMQLRSTQCRRHSRSAYSVTRQCGELWRTRCRWRCHAMLLRHCSPSTTPSRHGCGWPTRRLAGAAYPILGPGTRRGHRLGPRQLSATPWRQPTGGGSTFGSQKKR